MDIPQQRRDEIAQMYFDQLPFDPYPVQEEALFAWYANEQGVLVCAPTGTGKTLIAEAAIFEALHLGLKSYYTTPLIALTDQKFRELQEKVVSWGFSADDVGLVTGNRKVNSDARVLVVVAEILLNRLLHAEAFDFSDVWSVVMDEFHSFNDRERGIVWEFGLGLLPPEIKTLLISATVGNSQEFVNWMGHTHNRRVQLIESHDRKVPLTFQYVDDQMLPEQVELMVRGEEASRMTPALLFCFNREQCWTIAELLKGKKVVAPEQQKQLIAAMEQHDWSQGVGPKLKQILVRGVGVHHAGVLPRYRRIVEDLFQQKLLSICVCTETLAAGINLPARSVILPTLVKGPPRKLKLIPPNSAHQMFGRAGRPQFDDKGFVFVLAHEDDVKLNRWREKYDQIPEDTKDPGLRKAKKALKKKMPKRREGQTYWTEEQFQKLVSAPSADLASHSPLSWRLLVYLLDASPEVERVRKLVNGRLLRDKEKQAAQRHLNRMLITLWRGGYVTLEPKPPLVDESKEAEAEAEAAAATEDSADGTAMPTLTFGRKPISPKVEPKSGGVSSSSAKKKEQGRETDKPIYKPEFAYPTDAMDDLLKLRGVHPLYAQFLMNHLGIADRNERIMAFESLLELSRSLGRVIRIPKHDELPPGPLATTRLDPQLLKMGLATSEELGANEDEEEQGWVPEEEYVPILTLPHKLQRLFQHDFPGVDDLKVVPVWVAGEVLNYGTDFNKYITSNKLQKQEGVIFRHLLRMVLLLDEMVQLCPVDCDYEDWRADLNEIADQIEAICRSVDAQGTDQWLEGARNKDAED